MPSALRETEIVGLFAELWFLEYWLGPVTERAVTAWTGPARDRHDFKSSAASVEVKATRARADGSAAQRITSLEQLEPPEVGRLYIFSLKATPDAIGGHSLAKSVDRLHAALSSSPDTLRALDEQLGRAGYSPAGTDAYDVRMRITAEELYEVREDFPCLTHDSFVDGVPVGVDRISYTLNLAACGEWRIATSPTDAAAATVREALLHSAS